MFWLESRQEVMYYKRFRMEIDLRGLQLSMGALPVGYTFVPWKDWLLEMHAEVKFQCFAGEVDSVVFPNLGSRLGCLRLMREISAKPGFRPGATWLIARGDEFCGTVQGVRDRSGVGAIQNLGVTPAHRGKRLGTALLLRALEGFRQDGSPRALLEVTAQNDAAVRLYHRLGFRRRRSLYKAVSVANSEPWTADERTSSAAAY